jgi:hypothetical protein
LSNFSFFQGKLLLTHGYCAGDNPFQKFPEEWESAIYFEHPNANINNQQFAQELYDFVNTMDASSFGVVRTFSSNELPIICR